MLFYENKSVIDKSHDDTSTQEEKQESKIFKIWNTRDGLLIVNYW